MAESMHVCGAPRRPVLVAVLAGQRIAFTLDDVAEVLLAMATVPLPRAPALVVGFVNLRGSPLPILDLRTRLGIVPRDPQPDDHVVVCRLGDRLVGVWVDHADEVVTIDVHDVVAITEVAGAPHVQGVAVLPDGMLVVLDARTFLDADEALSLDEAMADPPEVVSV